MFGAFLFGSKLWSDTFRTPGVYSLSEMLTLVDSTPEITVIFVLNDFIFNADTSSTAPDRILGDSFRLNDWLTVKAPPSNSTFKD